MYQVIIVVHVLLGSGIIGLILMQQGKGADAGAAFGSGSSGSVFGAQGAASFLSRTTAILATLFFTTSLTLAVLNGQQSKKVDLMDTVEVEQKTADVPLAKTTTDTAAPVTPTSDTPVAGVSTTAPVSVTATPVVDSEKKDSPDAASKVDTDSKTADNKASADVTAKSETADSNEKKEADKKEAADKKAEKKHKSDKKKSSDKHEKKHDSDADKKDKK